MFGLTVWAYRRQMVQYEVDRFRNFSFRRHRGDLVDELLRQCERYGGGRGSINGAGTTAATAAHVIHAHVRCLSGVTQHLIETAGATGMPPNWDPYVAPFRLVPDWKGKPGRIERSNDGFIVYGNFRKIWSPKGQCIGCRLRQEGMHPAITEAIRREARRNYQFWYDGLVQLRKALEKDDRMTNFRVSGIGATPEPWNSCH